MQKYAFFKPVLRLAKVLGNVHLLGNGVNCEFSLDEKNAFSNSCNFIPQKGLSFDRMCISKNTYHSEEYKCKKTLSNVVIVSEVFFKIKKIVCIFEENLIERCYIIGTELIIDPFQCASNMNAGVHVSHIMHVYENPNNNLKVYPAELINDIALYAEMSTDKYVCKLACKYETE